MANRNGPLQIGCLPSIPAGTVADALTSRYAVVQARAGGMRADRLAVEHHDPELTGGEAHQRCAASYRMIRSTSGLLETSTSAGWRCSRPASSVTSRSGAARARAQYLLRGFQQGPQLCVAVGPLDCLGVDTERDVVDEDATIDLREIDDSLAPVGERVEGADDSRCDRHRGRARSGSACPPGTHT